MSYFKVKMHQIRSRLGLRWGSWQRSPRLPSWMESYFYGNGGERKEREKTEGKGRKRKGKKVEWTWRESGRRRERGEIEESGRILYRSATEYEILSMLPAWGVQTVRVGKLYIQTSASCGVIALIDRRSGLRNPNRFVKRIESIRIANRSALCWRRCITSVSENYCTVHEQPGRS